MNSVILNSRLKQLEQEAIAYITSLLEEKKGRVEIEFKESATFTLCPDDIILGIMKTQKGGIYVRGEDKEGMQAMLSLPEMNIEDLTFIAEQIEKSYELRFSHQG